MKCPTPLGFMGWLGVQKYLHVPALSLVSAILSPCTRNTFFKDALNEYGFYGSFPYICSPILAVRTNSIIPFHCRATIRRQRSTGQGRKVLKRQGRELEPRRFVSHRDRRSRSLLQAACPREFPGSGSAARAWREAGLASLRAEPWPSCSTAAPCPPICSLRALAEDRPKMPAAPGAAAP